MTFKLPIPASIDGSNPPSGFSGNFTSTVCSTGWVYGGTGWHSAGAIWIPKGSYLVGYNAHWFEDASAQWWGGLFYVNDGSGRILGLDHDSHTSSDVQAGGCVTAMVPYATSTDRTLTLYHAQIGYDSRWRSYCNGTGSPSPGSARGGNGSTVLWAVRLPG